MFFNIQFLVIVTDGIGHQWTQNLARLQEISNSLKANQVELLVVAIGGAVRVDEFKGISSGEKTVYNPKRFSDLRTLYKQVAVRLCKGK
jgi:predicted glycosyltransferase